MRDNRIIGIMTSLAEECHSEHWNIPQMAGEDEVGRRQDEVIDYYGHGHDESQADE